jgi:hypothetical protein
MPMSPEAKKAASDRMKAMHAAKAAEKAQVEPLLPEEPTEDEGVRPEVTGVQPTQVIPDGYAELLKTVAELQARLDAQPQALQQQAQINHAGALVGTFEKYITDPDYYPDPRERLSHEPRLAKFAFPLNYELGWEISVSAYETKQGVHTEEPRFSLELNYIIRDEENDEPTNGRYTLRKAVFHEDPAAAMAVAREQGIPIDKTNQKAFLDEMRYLRMKDWLIEAFYPARPDVKKQAKKQMVFGNRVVEYFEISSTESSGVPFDQLKSKLKS